MSDVYKIIAETTYLLVLIATLVFGLLSVVRQPGLLRVFASKAMMMPFAGVFVLALLIVPIIGLGLLLDQFPEPKLILMLLLSGAVLLAVSGAVYPTAMEQDESLLRPRAVPAVMGLSMVMLTWSFCSIVVLMKVLGGTAQEDMALGGVTIARPFEYLIVLLFALAAAVLEEIAFRGGVLKMFESLTGSVAAGVVISAMVFALGHGGYVEPHGIKEIQIFGLGLIFGYARVKYGLGAAIALHLVNNAVAMLLLPVGELFGPELTVEQYIEQY